MRVISDSAPIAEAVSLYGEPLPINSLGSHDLLRLSKRAVFSSRRCPPERMIAALDWARSLPKEGIAIFPASDRRLTEERSHERNRFAALLADEIFIVHADSGSHTEQLGAYARAKGKRLVAPA